MAWRPFPKRADNISVILGPNCRGAPLCLTARRSAHKLIDIASMFTMADGRQTGAAERKPASTGTIAFAAGVTQHRRPKREINKWL